MGAQGKKMCVCALIADVDKNKEGLTILYYIMKMIRYVLDLVSSVVKSDNERELFFLFRPSHDRWSFYEQPGLVMYKTKKYVKR